MLTHRFQQAPRSDQYDKLAAGVMKLAKVTMHVGHFWVAYPAISQKTGEQLLSMFRQLIIVVHGLIAAGDWLALIRYVRWANLLFCDTYTGAPRDRMGSGPRSPCMPQRGSLTFWRRPGCT